MKKRLLFAFLWLLSALVPVASWACGSGYDNCTSWVSSNAAYCASYQSGCSCWSDGFTVYAMAGPGQAASWPVDGGACSGTGATAAQKLEANAAAVAAAMASGMGSSAQQAAGVAAEAALDAYLTSGKSLAQAQTAAAVAGGIAAEEAAIASVQTQYTAAKAANSACLSGGGSESSCAGTWAPYTAAKQAAGLGTMPVYTTTGTTGPGGTYDIFIMQDNGSWLMASAYSENNAVYSIGSTIPSLLPMDPAALNAVPGAAVGTAAISAGNFGGGTVSGAAAGTAPSTAPGAPVSGAAVTATGPNGQPMTVTYNSATNLTTITYTNAGVPVATATLTPSGAWTVSGDLAAATGTGTYGGAISGTPNTGGGGGASGSPSGNGTVNPGFDLAAALNAAYSGGLAAGLKAAQAAGSGSGSGSGTGSGVNLGTLEGLVTAIKNWLDPSGVTQGQKDLTAQQSALNTAAAARETQLGTSTQRTELGLGLSITWPTAGCSNPSFAIPGGRGTLVVPMCEKRADIQAVLNWFVSIVTGFVLFGIGINALIRKG